MAKKSIKKDASRVGPLAVNPNETVSMPDYAGIEANYASEYPTPSPDGKDNRQPLRQKVAPPPLPPSATVPAATEPKKRYPTAPKTQRTAQYTPGDYAKYRSGGFGARIPESAKLERLRATRAALSKKPDGSSPAAPKPKAKPTVVVKPRAKPVAASAPASSKVTGTKVSQPAQRRKSFFERRMADRYSIGRDGKSM